MMDDGWYPVYPRLGEETTTKVPFVSIPIESDNTKPDQVSFFQKYKKIIIVTVLIIISIIIIVVYYTYYSQKTEEPLIVSKNEPDKIDIDEVIKLRNMRKTQQQQQQQMQMQQQMQRPETAIVILEQCREWIPATSMESKIQVLDDEDIIVEQRTKVEPVKVESVKVEPVKVEPVTNIPKNEVIGDVLDNLVGLSENHI